MPDLWRTVSGMSADDFLAARDRFVASRGELKRSGDTRHFPESFSPLHRANPNMLPMTYEGIRLLRRWHEDDSRRWHVPPLKPPAPPARTVTLLELMPGAFLKAVGLPYKGYKKGRRASELREEITGALAVASGIGLPNLASVRMGCHASDDFLDAVAAAVGRGLLGAMQRPFPSPPTGRAGPGSARRLDLRPVPGIRHGSCAHGSRRYRRRETNSRSVDGHSVAFRPGGTVEGRRAVVAEVFLGGGDDPTITHAEERHREERGPVIADFGHRHRKRCGNRAARCRLGESPQPGAVSVRAGKPLPAAVGRVVDCRRGGRRALA